MLRLRRYLTQSTVNYLIKLNHISQLFQLDGNNNRYLQKELQIINLISTELRNNQQKFSKFIVKYYGYQYSQNQKYYIISELCYQGDLYNHMLSFFKFYTFEMKLEFLVEISQGINDIHNLNICHRDLKPENILIAQDQQTNNYYLKITDFGISSMMQMNLQSRVGTVVYMAPEILSNKDYDYKVDIWSFGIIAHEIMTGDLYFPYQGDQQTIQSIKKHQKYERGRINHQGIEEVIENCLNPDPKNRMDSESLMKKLKEIQKDFYYPKQNTQQKSEQQKVEISRAERVSQILQSKTIVQQEFEEDIKRTIQSHRLQTQETNPAQAQSIHTNNKNIQNVPNQQISNDPLYAAQNLDSTKNLINQTTMNTNTNNRRSSEQQQNGQYESFNQNYSQPTSTNQQNGNSNSNVSQPRNNINNASEQLGTTNNVTHRSSTQNNNHKQSRTTIQPFKKTKYYKLGIEINLKGVLIAILVFVFIYVMLFM